MLFIPSVQITPCSVVNYVLCPIYYCKHFGGVVYKFDAGWLNSLCQYAYKRESFLLYWVHNGRYFAWLNFMMHFIVEYQRNAA